MAPQDGPSRMHGLHGKKLIYFLSIFVSLGVFLFGYDQGVSKHNPPLLAPHLNPL